MTQGPILTLMTWALMLMLSLMTRALMLTLTLMTRALMLTDSNDPGTDADSNNPDTA